MPGFFMRSSMKKAPHGGERRLRVLLVNGCFSDSVIADSGFEKPTARPRPARAAVSAFSDAPLRRRHVGFDFLYFFIGKKPGHRLHGIFSDGG